LGRDEDSMGRPTGSRNWVRTSFSAPIVAVAEIARASVSSVVAASDAPVRRREAELSKSS
jgi:hypothetical protein